MDEFMKQLNEAIGGYGSISLHSPVELPNGKTLKTRILEAHFPSFEEMRENFARAKDFLASHGFVRGDRFLIPIPQSYELYFGSNCEYFFHVGDPCPFSYQLTFEMRITLYFEEEAK